MASGYYRFPTIHGETIVFVCEDDLWTVPLSGGIARRLTANRSVVSRPSLSPDGGKIAFTGREDGGGSEVYLMDAAGGNERRLTYQGGQFGGLVVGWTPDGDHIVYSASAGQPFLRVQALWKVKADGGFPEPLPYGPARSIAFGPGGGVVIGRNTHDSAYWKRYRGGTAGELWIDPNGKGEFNKLVQLKGNLGKALWIGERIYFRSDHEGIANIYSCLPTGEDIRRHTSQEEYYVRFPSTDNRRIVYHAGSDIFVLDLETGEDRKLDIKFHSSQTLRKRKFVTAAENLEDYALHPEGHSVAITGRGKPFYMALWEGAATQYGERHGTRYRLARWTSDGKELITVSDADGEEAIELHPIDKKIPMKRFGDMDIGRPLSMVVSPHKKRRHIAFSNHRYELVFVDLDRGEMKVMDRSDSQRLTGVAWSPDGEWIAYGFPTSIYTACIKLVNISTGKTYEATKPNFVDVSPSFDPDGKFLYFLSSRIFNPVYDGIYFDLSFPRGMKPYLITLQKDQESPFIPEPKAPGNKPDEDAKQEAESTEDKKKEDKKKEDVVKPIEIDLENIQDRVVEFPVSEGIYHQIRGVKDKAVYTVFPIKGSFDDNPIDLDDESGADGCLMMYDFEEQKESTIVEGVANFKFSRHSKTLIYRAGNQLRVWKSGVKIDTDKGGENRESGWLNLSRIRVSVKPPAEWKQMYREAWRLQRQHFWSPNMSGIDWLKIYHRYLPLIDRVCTRSELSDLMWEMQGELGTSHCYEGGGDHRRSPSYCTGLLGADIRFDAEGNHWKIDHIVRGDSWNSGWYSPLAQPGLNVQKGDIILRVSGYPVDEETSPHELLVNLAGQEVDITLKADNDEGERTITVKTLHSEEKARYREWVEKNRQYVHQETHGRVGYVHIPDMAPRGYAEFYRYFLAELQYQGLIVDVRFNGGGHVSELILEKLAQKRVGYDISRWGKPMPYPGYALLGPIVALTNEHAGSDGDIFSHSFKLMKIGTLVGKRTWGGVVGIWPRHALVDGTVTTQPEFSFWFNDVQWNVENYGTDPDIEVDISPKDYAMGKDTQLDKTIEVILKQMEENPPCIPKFDNRPNLELPKLPK
ncbi:MAG: peptidase [Candidatus Cloacimonetes bacterium 4572_55]|nr:MAG: peptidase [Candidatus Cloacimonetes bacterium 4572_55]